MRYTYCVRIPNGFADLALKMLRSKNPEAKVITTDNKYILFHSYKKWREIQKYNFVEVAYIVTKYFIDNPKLENQLRWLSDNSQKFNKEVKKYFFKTVTLRVVPSRSNLDNKRFHSQIKKIENLISQDTNIEIDRGNPEFEVRIVEKSRLGFIGVRITKPPEFIDNFQKNSVRKEVASLMIFLSSPTEKDIFIDPMCGGGIIPLLRTYFPYKHIYAADKDITKIKRKLKSLNTNPKNFFLVNSNLKKLPSKLHHRSNKIVTDPPWGLIENIPDLNAFYDDIFNTFKQLSTNRSTIVILSSKEQIINRLIAKKSYLNLEEKYTGLISGRKASIFKIILKI